MHPFQINQPTLLSATTTPLDHASLLHSSGWCRVRFTRALTCAKPGATCRYLTSPTCLRTQRSNPNQRVLATFVDGSIADHGIQKGSERTNTSLGVYFAYSAASKNQKLTYSRSGLKRNRIDGIRGLLVEPCEVQKQILKQRLSIG